MAMKACVSSPQAENGMFKLFLKWREMAKNFSGQFKEGRNLI